MHDNTNRSDQFEGVYAVRRVDLTRDNQIHPKAKQSVGKLTSKSPSQYSKLLSHTSSWLSSPDSTSNCVRNRSSAVANCSRVTYVGGTPSEPVTSKALTSWARALHLASHSLSILEIVFCDF
eukprot:TRINITY_DN30487_c0_g1_i1.p2 TRINITY_DN30487_c0_g1~~TRINITY_DN30487_c0_g1_i1.p2  ORF type:complete len:131 (+),score=6.65 TRINITY_DN30487_c0_g1_i1:29-394(+)